MRAANSIMVRQDNVQQTSGLRPSFMQRWMWRTLFTGLSFIWATTPSAQAQTCVLQGTVSVSSTNASNDRLPGASLNLTSAEPNKVTLNTVTNEHGEYKFENLLRGNYTLQVILNGFKRTTRSITIHDRQPKTIIFWGQDDIFFTREGGEAYLGDLPDAEMHRLDSGHFAVEDCLEEIAQSIVRFYDEKVTSVSRSAA